MTMRMDVVTNDAGELVRREHARDLGAGVVTSIYRLAKLAQLHDLTNQAFLRQLDQTYQAINDYCLRSGMHVNVLYAQKAVFVAGQLLRGTRAIYDSALELGSILDWCGGSELTIMKDVTSDELLEFAEAISKAMRSGRNTFSSPTPKIRVRPVNEAARLRGLEVEKLAFEHEVVRTYASAVVIMRRFYDDLSSGHYLMPRRIKRIAQNLVDLSEGATPAFLGVSEVRNANADEAGRAVNSAILAVAMAREISDDRVRLAQIAMAAMMHDVARPRAVALAGSVGPKLAGVVARLSEDAEDRLPAGAAAVLTALGRVNEPSITRTVITFEALWIRRTAHLGPVYRGVRAPTLHAKIVAIARRYNDLMTPEPGLDAPPADLAIATLADELKDASDRPVLRMLVAALRFYPIGTVVQLTSGEVAEVVPGGDRSAGNELPRVRLVLDKAGGVLTPQVEVDLGDPSEGAGRSIAKVMSVEGWRKALELQGPIQERGSIPPAARPSSVPPPPAARPLSPRSERVSVAPPRKPAPMAMPARGEEGSERTILQASPIEEEAEANVVQATRGTPSGVPDRQARSAPSAKGALATTPLVHVLVYMLDHDLTGTVEFTEPGDISHAIYFRHGAPGKVKAGRMVAPLGEEMTAAGLLASDRVAEAVQQAKSLGVLLGEFLVSDGAITRGQLGRTLESQLVHKVARLVNMPPATQYVFYNETDYLAGWGGEESIPCDPLNAILASVRYWHDRARIRATLARIAKQPLMLHPDAQLGGLELDEGERAALEAIQAERWPLSVLIRNLSKEGAIADEETVSSLVYALAVTRQLAFAGQKAGPMGAGTRSASMRPPARQPSQPAISYEPEVAAAVTVRPQPRVQTAPSAGFAAPSIPAPSPLPTRVETPSPAQASVSITPAKPSATPAQAPVSVTPRRAPPAPTSEAAMAEAERALDAMTDFRLAEAALQRSDVAGAEKLAHKAVLADPDQVEYAALLAWVRAMSGNAAVVTESIQQLNAVIDADSTCERALLYRGKLLKRTDRAREALRDFEAVLEVNPKNKEAASEARLVKMRLGK
ncbi:MAG: Translation initiation factor 2 [Myxococcaceae bacterium]|nr:Translation initiation factor 2 [Myxococcaceae bacterium]